MANPLQTWLGQVTTGHGVMIVAPTLLAALAGVMNWTTAAPLLVAGTIGLVWPENTSLQADSQALATDVAQLVSSYVNKGKTVPAVLGSVPPTSAG